MPVIPRSKPGFDAPSVDSTRLKPGLKSAASPVIQTILPLKLYRVAGTSMAPTYQPGDLLVGWTWFKPKVGQVVVAQTAERPIIKRLKDLNANHIWLQGDNPAHSTDSRNFGPLLRHQIQALIIAKLG